MAFGLGTYVWSLCGMMSSMHLLLKPVTDVVNPSVLSDESLNILQSVLVKLSYSLASALSDHFCTRFAEGRARDGLVCVSVGRE